jgi:hypothetical protein
MILQDRKNEKGKAKILKASGSTNNNSIRICQNERRNRMTIHPRVYSKKKMKRSPGDLQEQKDNHSANLPL